MTAFAVVVFHVLGVISSMHAIMTTRTEQGAIAWAVSLITFPYVAVPAYWVLGRSRFQGYVDARRENVEEVAGVTKEALAAVAPLMVPDAEVDPAGRAAQRLAGIPYLRGNTVELLFAFASYNPGPGQVHQLRAEAERAGLDPNVWFNDVERIAAKHIGRETTQYVSNR